MFSDTILVYNKDIEDTDEDRRYIVWYAIEFVEDLLHKLAGTNCFFRAILSHGEFEHYNLTNIECFFGSVLVNAYKAEKKLPVIGLFIDDYCNEFNKYFTTARYAENLSFVYICRSLERLYEMTQGSLPVDRILIDQTEEFPFIFKELCFLRQVVAHMENTTDSKVRGKHATTWRIYHDRYGHLLDTLRQNQFHPKVICPTADWQERERWLPDQVKSVFGIQ